MRHFRFLQISIAYLAAELVLVLSTTTGIAQETAAKTKPTTNVTAQQQPTTQTADEDEQLDESFRKFGRAAGAAYQCTSEANREKVVRDIRHAYSRIGQLFGTDHAFYFAVAFGNATDDPFDKAKCPELIKKLQESVFVKRLTN